MWQKAFLIWMSCALIVGKKPEATDCGSQGGSFENFDINPCTPTKDGTYCVINRSFNATITMKIQSFNRINTLFTYPRGIIMHLNIPLYIRRNEACVLAFDPKCPLEPSRPYTYNQTWETWKVPKYEFKLQWIFEDETRKKIICAQIPVKFV